MVSSPLAQRLAAVTHLLFFCRPTAVFREVPKRRINAVDLKSVVIPACNRPLQKYFEIEPFITNANPFVFVVLRPFMSVRSMPASVLHPFVYSVNACVPHAVFA
jgi:hypothetical protein